MWFPPSGCKTGEPRMLLHRVDGDEARGELHRPRRIWRGRSQPLLRHLESIGWAPLYSSQVGLGDTTKVNEGRNPDIVKRERIGGLGAC